MNAMLKYVDALEEEDGLRRPRRRIRSRRREKSYEELDDNVELCSQPMVPYIE